MNYVIIPIFVCLTLGALTVTAQEPVAAATTPASQPVDRTRPDDIYRAIDAAWHEGDPVAFADCFSPEDGATQDELRRWAENWSVRHRLSQMCIQKFGPVAAGRIIKQCLRDRSPFREPPKQLQGWSIEGDTALPVYTQPIRGSRLHLTRGADGRWRLPFAKPQNFGKRFEAQSAEINRRMREMIDHFDLFETPGSIIRRIDIVRIEYERPSPLLSLAEADLKPMRAALDHPSSADMPSTLEGGGLLQHLQWLAGRLSFAQATADVDRAAALYVCEGDDGAYLRARFQRYIAARDFIAAADEELEASHLGFEFRLFNVADNAEMALYFIPWCPSDHFAVGLIPEGVRSEPFWTPLLTLTTDGLKIDITDEAPTAPSHAAARAAFEAAVLTILHADLRKNVFQTEEQLRTAMRILGIQGTRMPM